MCKIPGAKCFRFLEGFTGRRFFFYMDIRSKVSSGFFSRCFLPCCLPTIQRCSLRPILRSIQSQEVNQPGFQVTESPKKNRNERCKMPQKTNLFGCFFLATFQYMQLTELIKMLHFLQEEQEIETETLQAGGLLLSEIHGRLVVFQKKIHWLKPGVIADLVLFTSETAVLLLIVDNVEAGRAEASRVQIGPTSRRRLRHQECYTPEV